MKMVGTYYCPYPKRIGIICDVVLLDSLASAADFVYLSPDSWKDQVETIDLLLAVSTWRGLNGDEWFGVGKVGDPKREKFVAVIERCRSRGIPTVFYSKEDPPNYAVFLDFAKKCDVVFTSAEEMIPRYRTDCGHDRVYVLPFCFDPALQNPVGCRPFEQTHGVLFSGSWIIKYPFRCRDLEALLDGVLKSRRELVIVDRNSFRSGKAGYRFPKRFRKYLRPRMAHDELAAFHKRYEWSINVNSVTTSETMFAGRCYELLASGCPVISNFSIGMQHRLPEVAIADSSKYVAKVIRDSTQRQLQTRRAAGIRRVMTGETCYDRVAAILCAAGFDAEVRVRSVAVVVPKRTSSLQRAFDAQTYVNRHLYEESEFTPDIRAGHDYVISWLADESYGPYHLQDLIDVFKYTDAEYASEGDGYYEPIGRPIPGRTIYRTDVMEPVKGFGIPRSNDTLEDVKAVVDATHEISDPVGRSLASVRPSLLVRTLACFEDNGFLYTLRRILFGRSNGGRFRG